MLDIKDATTIVHGILVIDIWMTIHTTFANDGDTISIHVNMIKQTLDYTVNGKDFGLAFDKIEV